ncbi:acyltransferase family protein [Flavisphingomonas formosensis]|uniref:acyltransferase family protein n=1 Tax=Flavisphingomonas formosensis TaxID=861534 RepID=UPI0012FCF8A6|nr:acyltransferase [Sphingomonas formosensis]
MGFNRPLHGLRGVASLMVFFAHISYGYYDHFYHQNATMASVAAYFANFGTFGVELFFIISGYVITSSCLNYPPREFFGRRFWRLYPLFAMFTLLYFVLNHFYPQDPGRGHLASLVSNLLFLDIFLGTVPLTPNAWSISFEVWYYVATYMLVYSVIRRADRFNPFLAVAAIAFAGFMVAAFDITVYFVGGAFLFFINSRIMRDRFEMHAKTLAVTAVLIVVSVIATLWDFPPKTYLEVPGTELAGLALVVSTLFLVMLLLHEDNIYSRLLLSRPLRFMGTISYSLYLTHPYTYLVIRQIGYKIKLGSYPWFVTFPVYLLANMILALTASWIIHKVVEVGPYRLIYNSRIYRQPDTKMA